MVMGCYGIYVIVDNRYGVCRDKAVLLVAMLRLAGFKAFPVLIHAGAKLDPEVHQPFSTSRTYLLMDPTNENTKDLFPSYLCNNSYLVARPEGEQLMTSPVPPPEDNALDVTENEYTPIGATGYDRSDYFDPARGEFGMVSNVEDKYETKDEEQAEFIVRENGAVDISVANRAYGALSAGATTRR